MTFYADKVVPMHTGNNFIQCLAAVNKPGFSGYLFFDKYVKHAVYSGKAEIFTATVMDAHINIVGSKRNITRKKLRNYGYPLLCPLNAL